MRWLLAPALVLALVVRPSRGEPERVVEAGPRRRRGGRRNAQRRVARRLVSRFPAHRAARRQPQLPPARQTRRARNARASLTMRSGPALLLVCATAVLAAPAQADRGDAIAKRFPTGDFEALVKLPEGRLY